jgi:hypothetical protein
MDVKKEGGKLVIRYMENFAKDKGDFKDLYLSDEIVDTFKKAD